MKTITRFIARITARGHKAPHEAKAPDYMRMLADIRRQWQDANRRRDASSDDYSREYWDNKANQYIINYNSLLIKIRRP